MSSGFVLIENSFAFFTIDMGISSKLEESFLENEITMRSSSLHWPQTEPNRRFQ